MEKDYLYKNIDYHFAKHRDYSGRAIAKNDMQARKFHAHAVGSYILAYTADMNKREGGVVLKRIAARHGVFILTMRNYVRFARRWRLHEALASDRPWTELAYEHPEEMT